jgi:hypothetical protein
METDWLGDKVLSHPHKYFCFATCFATILFESELLNPTCSSHQPTTKTTSMKSMLVLIKLHNRKHLTPIQQDDLQKVFKDHKELFSGNILAATPNASFTLNSSLAPSHIIVRNLIKLRYATFKPTERR